MQSVLALLRDPVAVHSCLSACLNISFYIFGARDMKDGLRGGNRWTWLGYVSEPLGVLVPPMA